MFAADVALKALFPDGAFAKGTSEQIAELFFRKPARIVVIARSLSMARLSVGAPSAMAWLPLLMPLG